MSESEGAGTSLVKLYASGEFKHKAVGDKLTLRGYVSTNILDLSNDVCPPEAWTEFLPFYKENPIYCYGHWIQGGGKDAKMLMGDVPPYPIGRVNNPYVDDVGLMLDDIVLSNIPFVRDILSPLIQDNVLKQQSAGFFCLKQQKKDGVNYLLRNFLQEGSLVPLAANPFGTSISMKTIEGFQDFHNVDEIVKSYLEGSLVIAGKSFSVPTAYEQIPETAPSFSTPPTPVQHIPKHMSSLMPFFPGLAALEHQKDRYDPEGAPQAKPRAYSKTFDSIASMIHAVTVEGEGADKYLFQIGVPTDKGFRYDWDLLALATARVLGAKGGSKMTGTEKALVLGRLEEAYTYLGKMFPAYCKSPEMSIAKMADWKLGEVLFSEVEFQEGEGLLVKSAIARLDATNLLNALKAGDVPALEEVEELKKYLYGGVSLNIQTDGWDNDDLEFVMGLMQMWVDYNREQEAEDVAYMQEQLADMDKAVEGTFYKWQDGDLTKYAKGGAGQKGIGYAKEAQSFVCTKTLLDIPADAVKIESLLQYASIQKMRERLDARLSTIAESAAPFAVTAPSELSKMLSHILKED